VYVNLRISAGEEMRACVTFSEQQCAEGRALFATLNTLSPHQGAERCLPDINDGNTDVGNRDTGESVTR